MREPNSSGDLVSGSGWREAIIVVPDLAPWIETLTTVGLWEVADRRPADASLNTLWGLPPDARAEQVLMRAPGSTSGFIRLVKVSGAQQTQIRPNDQAWETGGLQALDLRVIDIETTRRALAARGWRAASDPVRYTAYGTLEVVQWAPVSPDGVRFSFIQRIAPPLQGWDEMRSWSRAFNAVTTIADVDAAEAYLTGPLGLAPAGATDTMGGDGPNVMGLPWAVARGLKVDIRGYSGRDSGDGAIELISLPSIGGRDFAANARPPNFGLAGLRFAAPAPKIIQSQSDGKLIATTAPGGLWLEFTMPPDA